VRFSITKSIDSRWKYRAVNTQGNFFYAEQRGLPPNSCGNETHADDCFSGKSDGGRTDEMELNFVRTDEMELNFVRTDGMELNFVRTDEMELNFVRTDEMELNFVRTDELDKR
jgi:hypothetical protein